MPNDLPDWTAAAFLQLLSASGRPLGDTGSPSLSKDSAAESISGPGVISGGGVIASFKPAAGLVFALVGVVGPLTRGTAQGSNPTYGQATSAGNMGVAWAHSTQNKPTTAAAGWVEATSSQLGGYWSALWVRPNLGAAEAPPAFTGGAPGAQAMQVQLAEYSGGALAAPTERTGSGLASGPNLTLTNSLIDAAFGDLVLTASGWALSNNTAASFADTLNNGAVPASVGHANDSLLGQFSALNFTFGIIPPARTALPLGVAPWDYDFQAANRPASGSQATITLAGVAGLTYRVSHMAASITAAVAAAAVGIVQLLDGATEIWGTTLGTQAAIGSGNHFELSGLALKGTAGASLTFRFSAGNASLSESVAIAGYLR